jgi:hypothetical protein
MGQLMLRQPPLQSATTLVVGSFYVEKKYHSLGSTDASTTPLQSATMLVAGNAGF